MSNKTECLLKVLNEEVLNKPLSDPLQREWIVINSKGMESWLRQGITRSLKISANLQFPFLSGFIDELIGRHQKFQSPILSREEPSFERKYLRWKIFELLENASSISSQLENYMGEGSQRELKRFQLAHRLAQLFQDYQVFRPSELHQWQSGGSCEKDHWQAKLWQELNKSIGAPNRIEELLTLYKESSDLDLRDMERVSVFGLSSIPPSYLSILQTLSNLIEVHVFFLNPCKEDWSLTRNRPKRPKKKSQPSLLARHLEICTSTPATPF